MQHEQAQPQSQAKRRPSSLQAEELRRQAERHRRALREIAREHFDGKLASWARAAELNTANSLYNFLAGRADFLATSTLEKLRAAVPGLTISQMLGSDPAPQRDIVIPIRQRAAAGKWQEASQGTEDLGRIIVPSEWKLPCTEGVLIADRHADGIYPAGAKLGWAGLAMLPGPLNTSDRVLVRRIRNGLSELTVREITEADADRYLVYRSSQEGLGSIVRLPWPQAGAVFDVEGDRFQILGKVVLAFLREL